jgi:predicted O-methyltransferase YrrM
MSRLTNYMKRYMFACASGLYAFTAGQVLPKNRALLNKICEHFNYDPGRPEQRLPSVSLRDIVPDETCFRILEPSGVDGNVTLFELMIIVKLVCSRSPAVIFEIGTFDGRTTLNMAANSPENTGIFTLDLPAEGLDTHKLPLADSDRKFVDKKSSGGMFAGTEFGKRVTQLYGDSATFDFSRFHGAVDFIFIDGAHTYEYVLNDTERALKMLRAGKGIVLWHDYGGDMGTTYALNDLLEKDRRLAKLVRFEGTSLAMCVFD